MPTKSETGIQTMRSPKSQESLQNIFGNRGVQKSMALILGGFLDCVKNLIQDRFKQFHVLFEGRFPIKFFGVFSPR